MSFSGNADQIIWSAFLNSETVLASVAACDKTPAFLPNLIIQWIEVEWKGPLIISDEVKAIWLAETQNLKR